MNPKRKPPTADAISVSELRKPAVRVSMENSRNKDPTTKEKSMTSMASSSQPSAPATRVFCSAGVTLRGGERSALRGGGKLEIPSACCDGLFTGCGLYLRYVASEILRLAKRIFVACPPGVCYAPAQRKPLGGPEMAFCRSCGQEVGTAAFCSKCGASQGTEVAPAGAGAPAASVAVTPTEGIQENVAGLLCYLFGWISGLIFLLIDKRPFVRFHGAQSIAFNIAFGAIW